VIVGFKHHMAAASIYAVAGKPAAHFVILHRFF